jgi:quercetin dioxygenase-like cupin family protein
MSFTQHLMGRLMTMNRYLLAGSLLAASTLALADKAKPAGTATFVVASEIKWADVPGFKGVQIATAEGDPNKGPAHFYLKFASGFAAPLHHHSADHHGTVVAGTLVLNVDGKDVKLPPGSYFGFLGAKPHTTSCMAGPECILAMDARDKWDVVPEKK